ncbi:MAG: flagellar hook-associated protein FlgK, partial [Clostridiales bacterium 43-6]
MRSTFFGFEIARKALNASQKGLDVTGQNISNINTEGYTRQRVDLTASGPVGGASLFADTLTIPVGQGVDITGISQIRNIYLDSVYYRENAQNNTIDSGLNGLREIENIIDEVSTDGLGKALSGFYQSLQTLSVDSANPAYASLLRSAAQKVTQIINNYANQLSDIESGHVDSLVMAASDINSLINKIEGLNGQIKLEQLRGNSPGELLDIRNNYLDKLSSYISISTEMKADGTVSVKSGGMY